MYRHVLDDTNDSYDVYVNAISSDAGHYLSRRPQLFSAIRQLLPTLNLKGPRMVVEKDMGHHIGMTDVVRTSETDSIYYAQLPKSDIFLRFAKNRHSQSSSKLTMTFVKDDNGDYEVSDVWIGANHPPFPGDENATETSRGYWDNHALVQGAYLVSSKSITTTCPYM